MRFRNMIFEVKYINSILAVIYLNKVYIMYPLIAFHDII